MKIIVATDKFKGSLSAQEAAEAMARGVARALPGAEIVRMPMADGGEGTLACLLEAAGGRELRAIAQDPLGREREAVFGVLTGAGRVRGASDSDAGSGGAICVVELAAASGHVLLRPEERDPLRASTYGFGQLIRAGLDAGARRFLLCLGGSATNDGGAGMLQALGFRLLGADGRDVGPGGAALAELRAITAERADPRLRECEWIVACDVDNPLIGERGASAVYGPQKGATPEQVRLLDAALARLADAMAAATGCAVHELPGAGAAGGTAGALVAMLGARLESGAQLCIRASGLERELADAALVLSGEGRIDSQTLNGKTPLAVAQTAHRHGVPALLFGGSVEPGITPLLADEGVLAAIPLADASTPLEEAVAHAAEWLESRVEQALRAYLLDGFNIQNY